MRPSWKLYLSIIAVTLLVAENAVGATFCGSLKRFIRAADNDFDDLRGRYTEVTGALGASISTEAHISKITLPGFSLCAIGEDRLFCVGPDQYGATDQLEEHFSAIATNITKCLSAKRDIIARWYVSRQRRWKPDEVSQRWTDQRERRRRKERTMSLAIDKDASSDLYVLKFDIEWL